MVTEVTDYKEVSEMSYGKIVVIGCLACSMAMLTDGCRLRKRPASGGGVESGMIDLSTSREPIGPAEMPGRFETGAPVAQQFADVLFAYDSAQIDSTEESKLAAVTALLKRNPNVKLTLEGHCDERGSREYNMTLGERRALAVRAFLLGANIDPSRMQTISWGKERPKDPGHTEEAWSLNRRVEFKVTQ